MGIVIDIIIAVICALIIIKAYRHGLVKSVMGLVKGIASFIAAYSFTPTLGDIIYKNFALKHISGGIAKTIESLSKNSEGTFDLSEMFAEMPDSLKQIINRYSVDSEKLGEMCENITDGTSETVAKVSEYIASPIADSLSSAVAFILIFVGVFLALSIVTFLVDAVFHLPVLSGMNKFLGLVFGIAEALILAVLISSVCATIITTLGSVDTAHFGSQVVEGSFIMNFFSSVDLFGLLETAIK